MSVTLPVLLKWCKISVSVSELISQSDLQPPLLTTTMTNGKAGETGELQVSVAANETVGTSAGGEPQTIMIIHEDQLEECGSIGSSLEDQQLDVTDSVRVMGDVCHYYICYNKFICEFKATRVKV